MSRKIILLSSACFQTTVLYNYISKFYAIDLVIEEKPIRGFALAKRRFKRMGFFRVSSQIAFTFLVVPFLSLSGKKRIAELKKEYQFDDTAIPGNKIVRFDTVNDQGCIELIQKTKPDIILVSGTRIISKKVLQSCIAPFINMHAGITPNYRGVHGGYWAVANRDFENFGVTIHRVDAGIDTGEVLYQKRIKVSSKDNYTTYPYLQLGEGLPLMKQAVTDIFAGKLKAGAPLKEKGNLWYHPTLWQYFFYRPKK